MKQKRKTSVLTILFRILFTICLVYSVVFIFRNSLEIASVSSERSEQVQQIVNEAAGTVGLGPFSLHAIRKLAHFTEFMVMGFWFMLCLRVYTRHFIKHISWPLFLGLGTAVADETIQTFVAGRGSSVKDVWIDFAGFVAGLFVALVILMFLRMCVILFVHRHDGEEEYQEEPPALKAVPAQSGKKKKQAVQPPVEEEWEEPDWPPAAQPAQPVQPARRYPDPAEAVTPEEPPRQEEEELPPVTEIPLEPMEEECYDTNIPY